jgi:hypothetical protein
MCLAATIKSMEWSTPMGAAKQIAAIFRVNSLLHHSTHLSILESNEILASGISKATHQFVFIDCVATTLNLELVL